LNQLNYFRISIMTDRKAALATLGSMTLTAAIADADDPEVSFEAEFRKELEQYLPGISKGDRDPQQRFQQSCLALGTPGREQDRAAACAVIAATLAGELDKPARIWLIKQCQHIGREECVDEVAQSLDYDDLQIRDAARRALTDNPSAAANAALLAAAAKATGSFRVGLINSLGYRGDPDSVDSLASWLSDKDASTVAAAANALGKIADDRAAKALKSALSQATDELKGDLADAYLRCAERLLDEGRHREAGAIYAELSQVDLPAALRLAVVRGRLNAATGN
jgi:hypothetical protein